MGDEGLECGERGKNYKEFFISDLFLSPPASWISFIRLSEMEC